MIYGDLDSSEIDYIYILELCLKLVCKKDSQIVNKEMQLLTKHIMLTGREYIYYFVSLNATTAL